VLPPQSVCRQQNGWHAGIAKPLVRAPGGTAHSNAPHLAPPDACEPPSAVQPSPALRLPPLLHAQLLISTPLQPTTLALPEAISHNCVWVNGSLNNCCGICLPCGNAHSNLNVLATTCYTTRKPTHVKRAPCTHQLKTRRTSLQHQLAKSWLATISQIWALWALWAETLLVAPTAQALQCPYHTTASHHHRQPIRSLHLMHSSTCQV
jgi:hypothetical protein